PGVLALRARQSRAMLTTLLLSFGIPMLLGGDEMGRTQQGNNNAYCQDTEIAWFDWSQPDAELLDFTRRLVAFRRAHPVFRRRQFLAGAAASQLRWFTPGGTEVTPADWSDGSALAVALYLDGSDDPDRAADGTLLLDDDFLVLVNAWWEPLDFTIPAARPGLAWQLTIDSYDPQRAGAAAPQTAAGRHPRGGPQPHPGRGGQERRPGARSGHDRVHLHTRSPIPVPRWISRPLLTVG